MSQIPEKLNTIEKDFMVLSYFVGNDFLPGVFSTDVQQFDNILAAYIDTLNTENKNLVFYLNSTSTIQIDWYILSVLCSKLGSDEFFLIKKLPKYKTSR